MVSPPPSTHTHTHLSKGFQSCAVALLACVAVPWVPEVIFFVRLKERSAAELLQQGVKRRKEKNSLWSHKQRNSFLMHRIGTESVPYFSSRHFAPHSSGSATDLSLNLAKKITSGTLGGKRCIGHVRHARGFPLSLAPRTRRARLISPSLPLSSACHAGYCITFTTQDIIL